jgi:uncharacterized protein YecE (DUF72 family)
LRIGTSGWSYDHWVGGFYPERTAAAARLGVYAETFDSVEINNTFYSLPDETTVAEWRRQVPDGFRFAVKASRYLTHMKKLKEPQEPLQRLLDRVAPLGDKLGPLLFQLPPNWRVDHRRLEAFLDLLPKGRRYAFELRDPSWHDAAVRRLLEGKGAAFCIFDIGGERSPVLVTTDFVYLRLHGPGAAYRGSYDGRTLFGWARRCQGWLADGLDVYCYFDNDEKAFAPKDARRLKGMLERNGDA